MPRLILLLLPFVLSLAGCSGQPSQAATARSVVGSPASAIEDPSVTPLHYGPVVIGTAPEHGYSDAQIARGGALVQFGACDDCHTPWIIDPEIGGPAPDMRRRLSGHPRNAPPPQTEPQGGDMLVIGASFTSFRMPFGVTYALNLTPDIDTGTGSWSEEMFLRIFREAKHMGGNGRTVLPPMPWPAVASLGDEDLVSIFAFLRSLPPIRNAVPSADVPLDVIDEIGRSNAALLAQMKAGAH